MLITYYTLDTIDSTNNWAKRRARSFVSDELAVISAVEQTDGRGCFERSWYSPRKCNLYLSFAFSLPKVTSNIFCYSQMAACAIHELLKENDILAQVKWPNDLLVNGKKIAGILTETHPFDKRCLVVVGIGLNVNMEARELKHIEKPATSMAEITSTSWSLEEVKLRLVTLFSRQLKKEFAEVMTTWHQLVSWMVGTYVKVQRSVAVIDGSVKAIEPDGTLIVDGIDGKLRIIRSGEILN